MEKSFITSGPGSRNPPNNLNLEEAGRDLRTRTCLDMELIPRRFTFFFEQGINSKNFYISILPTYNISGNIRVAYFANAKF